MIASGAVPALLPAHIGVSQTSQISVHGDFADTLAAPRRSSAGPSKPSTAPADLRTSVAEVGSHTLRHCRSRAWANLSPIRALGKGVGSEGDSMQIRALCTAIMRPGPEARSRVAQRPVGVAVKRTAGDRGQVTGRRTPGRLRPPVCWLMVGCFGGACWAGWLVADFRGEPDRRRSVNRGPGDEAVIRTPDRRLRVFVSSTLGELAEERRAVSRAVSALRLTPVMFEAGARPYPPAEVYRAYLAADNLPGVRGRALRPDGGGAGTGGIGREHLVQPCQRPSCGPRWWPGKSPHPSG